MRWFIGYNVSGLESLNKHHQWILAANHNSHLDTLAILSSLSVRQALSLHPVAAKDYFDQSAAWARWSRWLFNLVTISRRRVSKADNPLTAMKRAIQDGESLLIFPEGSRGEPDQIATFHSGVAHVAEHFPALPIVPVYLSGTGKSLPRGALVPLPIWIDVRFGEPFFFHDHVEKTTRDLENRIREMNQNRPTPGLHLESAEPKVKKPIQAAVIGIDGSGKSTAYRHLIEVLGSTHCVCGIGDTLFCSQNGQRGEIDWIPGAKFKMLFHRLAKRASRMRQYRFFKLIEMISRQKVGDVMMLKFRPTFVLSDGHPLINLLAWGVFSSGQTFKNSVYEEAAHCLLGGRTLTWDRFVFFLRKLPSFLLLRSWASLRMPEHVLFLKVSPNAAMERISRRGEKIQMHESEDKLNRLQQAYEEVLSHLRSVYGLSVDTIDSTGQNASAVREQALRWAQQKKEAPS